MVQQGSHTSVGSAGSRLISSRWSALLRAVFVGVVAAGLMVPVASVQAQDLDAAAKAAAAAAARAKAKAAAEARERAETFASYLQEVHELAQKEAKIADQRIGDATQALKDQKQALREQVQRRNAAEQRSNELDDQYAKNKAHLTEITALLKQHEGNLGELFGVTRQVAGDVSGVFQSSMVSTQLQPPEGKEDRSDFMVRIAAAKALPSIGELRRIWYELLRELAKGSTVERYTAPVTQLDGSVKKMEVTRVGPFSMTTDSEFLGYSSSSESLIELNGELPGKFQKLARQLDHTSYAEHPGYIKAVVDPSGATGGGLLGIYLRRPNWIQRIELGEVVGYVIIAVGIIAVLLALFQYVYLIRTRFAVKAQLRDLDEPKRSNPLGRVMLAFSDVDESSADDDVAGLRLSEAVSREVPRLERFQAFLRLAIAAGPLLGLIGTVVGMIITFHAIVASGATDPRLMARGIGQAMIATVLGLSVAIPLLFINAGLAVFSRGLSGILDEHSQQLLADRIRHNKKQRAPQAT